MICFEKYKINILINLLKVANIANTSKKFIQIGHAFAESNVFFPIKKEEKI